MCLDVFEHIPQLHSTSYTFDAIVWLVRTAHTQRQTHGNIKSAENVLQWGFHTVVF